MIDVQKLKSKIILHMPITKKELAYAILYLVGMEHDLCQCNIKEA